MERLPDLTTIETWHAECLRVLREVYGDASPVVADWRLIPFDWGMVYQGEWVDETFFKNLDDEDQEHHSRDIENYWYFRRGRLEEMKAALLEYISIPTETGTGVAQAKAVFHVPNLDFIDDQELKKICRERFESARICSERYLHLPAIILLASAVEGMLFSMANQRKDKWENSTDIDSKIRNSKVDRLHMGELLSIASAVGWVSKEDVQEKGTTRESGMAALVKVLSDVRNNIHPARQAREASTYGEHDFTIAWSMAHKVASEIDRWRLDDQNSIGPAEEN